MWLKEELVNRIKKLLLLVITAIILGNRLHKEHMSRTRNYNYTDELVKCSIHEDEEDKDVPYLV